VGASLSRHVDLDGPPVSGILDAPHEPGCDEGLDGAAGRRCRGPDLIGKLLEPDRPRVGNRAQGETLRRRHCELVTGLTRRARQEGEEPGRLLE